jgi:hypothetical protein
VHATTDHLHFFELQPGNPAAITSPITLTSFKTSHQRLTKKEALVNTTKEMGSGIVPNPPDGTLVENAGASDTGIVDGTTVGTPEGTSDGTRVGTTEGSTDGNVEGITEGCSDGESDTDGDSEETTEGNSEGSTEGNNEGSIEGKTEGSIEGIVEGSRDGDTDGAAEEGRVCSVHVHLATGNTLFPRLLAKAPLAGSRSIEYIKMGKAASSGKKRSFAVPASKGKVST